MPNKIKHALQRITECADHLRYVFGKGYRFARIKENPVLEISRDVYQPVYSKGDPNFFRNDWTVLAFRAFKHLKTLIPKNSSVCIVGTGGGLDALGVIEILDPAELMVTDLSNAALNQSLQNILGNLLPHAKSISCETQAAFLFNNENFKKASYDFIYENLPNLPLRKRARIVQCNQPVTASYYYQTEIEHEAVPKTYADNLLSLHWLFLQSARRYLKPGGRVLCSIGGRIDYEIIEKMFYDAGYKAELVIYDFKRQNEATSNLPGYAREEKKRKGLPMLRYFQYQPVMDILAKTKQHQLRGFATNRKVLQGILKDRYISAQKACDKFQANKTEIGHEVYFITGTLLPT